MTVPPASPVRRVLVLSGLQVHPPQSGGNLRTFALVNALRRHDLDLFVYSLVGRKREYLARQPSAVARWPSGVEEYVERGPLSFLAGYGTYGLGLPPLWLTAYLKARARRLPRLLREKLAWSDVVVADFPFVHPVFGAPEAKDKRRVLSTHNIEHHLLDEHGPWSQRFVRERVRGVEERAALSADVVMSCCAGDREFFEQQAPRARSVMVPNGIDLARFAGIEVARSAARRDLGIAEDTLLVLFTGSKWGPNREAFDYLRGFAGENVERLTREKIHILVVGNVTSEPVRAQNFTATGKVEVVEPYFAAADAALNPINSGAGTNVKMGEFMAVRLPLLATPFGARGFRIEHGRTGLIFERPELGATLTELRRLWDVDPGRLRRMAEDAYRDNAGSIDMFECVRPLVDALHAFALR